MKQFIKFVLASTIGFLISIFILTFIFFMFFFAVVSSFDSVESVTVYDDSVLELSFNYEIPERSSYEPIVNYSLFPSMGKTIGLNDINRLIKNAKTDSRIEGIYLDLDNFYAGGIAKINSIREALLDFKTSDKFLIAHGNSINEKAFYLASVADSIYLTSTGNLEFDGFGIEIAFYKDALDKLEVEPQVFQAGKFKSATEPYRLNKLSRENEEQIKSYLKSVYKNIINKISRETGIDYSILTNIANELKINSAEDALELGFVKGLIYEDEVDSIMSKIVNPSKKLKKISAKKYLFSMNGNSNTSSNRIAVIYALGEIVNGAGDEYSIGTKNIIRSIKKARENKRIKAIVMRVNSPGGSPLTSDMIWREIELASKEKPFIVSMGDVAASGGYYISCSADKIIAEESTLAGSIGVYGMIPNTQRFFNNKIGITFDRVETGEQSNLFTITTPLSTQQKQYIQEQIDDIYFDFVTRVADGRNMKYEDVDKIAEGRIWSGLDAKNIGLIDTLGGLELALNIAAQEANIKDYKLIEYPSQKEAFEKIMEFFASEIENKFNNIIIEPPLNQISKLAEALKYTGIQTRLPFEYIIY